MVKWQEYTESLEGNQKIILNKVFFICEEFINFSQKSYKDNSVVELRVEIKNQSSYARYSNCNICIDIGLINFLEEVHSIFFDENPLNEESYSFLIWSVAHELSHHLQKHQKIKNDSDCSPVGLEFDADRVAVNLLFNYLIKTNGAKQKSIIELKLGILNKLYMPMRLKSENSVQLNSCSTHPPWLTRLLQFVTFLATEGNESNLCSESISHLEILFENMSNLELFYTDKNSKHVVSIKVYANLQAEKDFEMIINEFEKIRQKL